MTRFCGNCGTGLDAAALASGRCPTCGVPIAASGDPLVARDAAPKRDPDIYPFTPPSPAPEQAPAPWWPGEGRRGGGRSVPWLIGAAAVAAVLLFGTLAYVLARSAGTTSSSQVGTSSPTSALATATATAPVATATPTQEAQTPTTTPSLTPVTGDLSVQPTKFTPRLCITSAQVQFTVANTGEASLTWSATSDRSYDIDPGGGTLNGGDQVLVTVSNILHSGSVTISAPGAQNSPQTVTIKCTV